MDYWKWNWQSSNTNISRAWYKSFPGRQKTIRDILLKKGHFYLTIDDVSWHIDSFFEGDNRKTLAKILQREWSHGPNISEANEQQQSKITKEITERFNIKNPDGTGDYAYHQAFIDVMQKSLRILMEKKKFLVLKSSKIIRLLHIQKMENQDISV